MTDPCLQQQIGDVMEWAAQYQGPKFHACLCDPPYHLTSIVKRFANGEPAHTKTANDIKLRLTPHARQAAGFMGQQWDGGDIAFRPELWAALGQHLHPGAFLMAFAGTRGYHRMACAIEDAGFVLHPVLVWAFGSGFPKATRIDTQIDREAGAEVKRGKAFNFKGSSNADGRAEEFIQNGRTMVKHEPATDMARAWAGHRYGLQALKPACEMICLAQKPYKGRPIDNITLTGAGALNVDAARIDAESRPRTGSGSRAGLMGWGWAGNGGNRSESGRWPANLILSEEGAAVMDRQSGHLQSGFMPSTQERKRSLGAGGYNDGFGPNASGRGTYGDAGGASRFFARSDWQAEVAEQVAMADALFYTAKAGRTERDAGLQASNATITPTNAAGRNKCQTCGGWQHNAGSASNRPKSTCFCATPSLEFVPSRQKAVRNVHPCVKPIRLTRWLASLLLPPAGYAPRRILNPFGGSGSEAIGAGLAGWEEIVSIEQSAEYAALAEARFRFWACNVGLFDSLTAAQDAEENAQGGFEF